MTARELVAAGRKKTPHLVLWMIVGLAGGVFAGLYWNVLYLLLEGSQRISGWGLLLLMPAAGLAIGWIITRLGDPGEISLIVDNIHFRGGRLDVRNNPSMILSSLLSIASGGSAGPEAPMVQVTGSFGTWFADRLGLRGEALRTLSIAGMAAGFTALFGAPLGGAIFALEILHHQHVVEYFEALLPAVIASCSGYVVFAAVTHLGFGPTWVFPLLTANEIADFGLILLFGFLGAACGWLFVTVFRGIGRTFERIPGPFFLKTGFAGLLLGTIAFVMPLTRFFGHDEVARVVTEPLTVPALGALILLKMIAISVTIAGGWRGGIIIPLFFIGACLGKLAILVLPGQINPALAMVGVMAGINASVTRTPISTAILLAKLTGTGALTPILFASLAGFLLAPRTPLIRAQLKRPPSGSPLP
ncbi:MAG: Voltage-gated ClC-type chloride channel ClcB [candidate division BRC1 bacterium ADurb.BinA292]|nr:MAG: Voltage-gated ClC-type chloride channel ClcB [candidate division BRC1 bacterium ADurb.BinA292]